MTRDIILGADHGGLPLKSELDSWLQAEGYQTLDLGAHSPDPADDYPDFAEQVAGAVASRRGSRGILICGSGVGACVAANKIVGARACLCHDIYSAHQGVEHDDMNILCLGARVIGIELAKDLVSAFLKAQFTGEGRHVRRLEKVAAIEHRALIGETLQATGGRVDDEEAQLQVREHRHPGVSLGGYLPDVESALVDLQRRDVLGRVWRGDHTVWKPDPTEIADRLGWLSVTDVMRDQVPDLKAFADEVRSAGFRHVALLGMGGSSLGPEVLRRTFGSSNGYPELIVLDSTVPAWVEALTDSLDPERTLFLVSSKSGSTTEPNTFYAHFRSLVEGAVGVQRAGKNFVAITDPGTPLENLARDQGFRRVFLNPSDIGGRYSVLSYFGLVPAVLTGIDITLLLDRAGRMRDGCASGVPARENPGAWLGATMGMLARQGRDKLTLVTSPSISGFGLWVEQLIAESAGKEGKGIVPVAGEPLVDAESYGDDRLFVYLRLEGDNNFDTDSAIEKIQASGQPVVRLDLRDRYDMGAEFFRWEFGTVVAGAILGINPYDQPNVQSAKDMTESVLKQYQTSGCLPQIETSASLVELLAQVRPGDYLAIMAYLRQTPELDNALDSFRRKVVDRYGIATTTGYGPRYLHSTGQLHKGGPASGVFLQITASHEHGISIPGTAYTFGTLADAQALGDLEALQALGRRTARIHFGSSSEASGFGLPDQLP